VQRGLVAVRRACGSCGRQFACLPGSVADQFSLCLRCFQRKVRFPGLCQRP